MRLELPTLQQQLLEKFQVEFDVAFKVTLCNGAYCVSDRTLSNDDQFTSSKRAQFIERKITLADYIAEMTSSPLGVNDTTDKMWYLFPNDILNLYFGNLLKHYDRPICDNCADAILYFALGGENSGVLFHHHAPGFSEVLHGTKRWALYPPDKKPPKVENPLQSMATWFEQVVPSLPPDQKPYECVVQAGEMIYFPENWYHATLNQANYTASVSSFIVDGNFFTK